jgi:hypothetical protein
LLIDEADGLNLNHRDGKLRSLFNSGHRRGGSINVFVAGRPQRYRTFAPLAIAAIGMLPLPLMHRAVVINMQRSGTPLRQLDDGELAFRITRTAIEKWSATFQLELAAAPKMPAALRNRAADNWRSLLSIADVLGCGTEARAAAVALSADRPDEDPGVTLLKDIRTIFQGLGPMVDRIASLALVEALLGLEDGLYNEWRGPHDDRAPRKLTQGELSRLLRVFGIRSRTIWPARRGPGDRSCRGYLRADFEVAWRRYCGDPADTPTQPSRIIPLGPL